MANLVVTYLQNHRQQVRMVAFGVTSCLLLVFGESNERALFAAPPVSNPAALVAITDNEVLLPDLRQQRISSSPKFVNPTPPSKQSPGIAPNTPVVLAFSDPGNSFPISDGPIVTPDNFGSSTPQQRGYQGGPLAGSSPPGAGAAGFIDTVPGVPEPHTWLMMIVGFFGVGSVLRLARRRTSVQLELVTDQPD